MWVTDTALVLEDSAERVTALKQKRLIRKITHVESVKAFREAYSSSSYSFLILDHDLGGELLNSRDANMETGQHAVTYLCRLEGLPPPTLVWSCNTLSAPIMATRLQKKGCRAEWIPYVAFAGAMRRHLIRIVG